MTFSISDIAGSLAAHLAPFLSGVTFYEDPVQGGGNYPCMFLQVRGSSPIAKRMDRRYLRTLRLDLTYLEDYNLPDLQARYERVQEILDEHMELFSYTSNDESTLLRTYNREAKIDLDALHYNFELRVFVLDPEEGVLMKTIEHEFDPPEPDEIP